MDRGEMDREQYESRGREMNANVREALAAKRRYVIGEAGEGIVGTKVAAPVEEEGGGWYLLAKCSGITRAGTACKGIPIDGSDYCYAHHPRRIEERRRHGSKGGKRGGRGRPVAELGNLRDENAEIRQRLLEGELLPGVAAVAIQSLNCDVRVVAATLKAKEQEEVEARLDAIEETIERDRGTGRYGA